jgi:TPR repeat protein
MFKLADIYRYGRTGVEKNEALAKEYDDKVYEHELKEKLEYDDKVDKHELKKLKDDAEDGNVYALRVLASMYKEGKGVEKNVDFADLLDKQANQLESAASKK